MEGLEYIDDYFKGELPADETERFENKIAGEPAFAGEVAFYLSVLQAAKELSAEEKVRRFREIYLQQGNTGTQASPVRRLWPRIAVAAIVAGIIFGLFIFTRPASPQQLADHYIQQHFQNLAVTMSSRENSMQTGLRLNNEGKLAAALEQFEKILQSDTADFTAKENAGIVSLRMENYDKALDYFRQLEKYTGNYTNPAKFYEALTHMKRNRPGDEQQAKQLLQQVVENDLEGKDDAALLLKKL
jgi:tetratricopeptide (TPR) repeat protein